MDMSTMPSFDIHVTTGDDDNDEIADDSNEPCAAAQASVQSLVDETPEIMEFLQQIESSNS
jgi:hypothetical protein